MASSHLTVIGPRYDEGLAYVRTSAVDTTHALLRLIGEFDIATAPLLTCAVAQQIDQGRVHLHLDLAGVLFCDVAGFEALASAQEEAAAAGGVAELHRPTATLHQLARWCGAQGLLSTGANEPPPLDTAGTRPAPQP